MKLKFAIAALGYLLMAGCTAITPLEKQYSGYLGDYSNMETADTPDGSDVKRWISPALKKGTYKKVIVQPVTYFPAPRTSEQVKLETLNEISEYLTNQIKAEVGKNFEITDKSGPDTLTYQIAITGVDTPLEGMKLYEVVPIAMVYSGASLAMGMRDHVVVIYIEGLITDSITGEEVAKGLRQGVGQSLRDDNQQLDIEKVKKLLNGWASEVGMLGDKLL